MKAVFRETERRGQILGSIVWREKEGWSVCFGTREGRRQQTACVSVRVDRDDAGMMHTWAGPSAEWPGRGRTRTGSSPRGRWPGELSAGTSRLPVTHTHTGTHLHTHTHTHTHNYNTRQYIQMVSFFIIHHQHATWGSWYIVKRCVVLNTFSGWTTDCRKQGAFRVHPEGSCDRLLTSSLKKCGSWHSLWSRSDRQLPLARHSW